MQFLFPSFLWALLAVAIPLIIHLFNFRRTKRVYFTNVSFLKAVNTTTSSFRRLKQLLVMAARMLAIACLVLAFAQPFLPASNGSGINQGGIASFYLDNSLSMQNELDKKNELDRAIAKVEELLTVFPQGSQLQLITNDFGAEEHALTNPTGIKERTTGIRFAHTPRTLEQVYRRQQSLATKHQTRGNQFFWFSDFQKSTAGNLAKLPIDSTTRIALVPVVAKNNQNVFVDSVWLSTPFVREMQSNILSVRLFNSGTQSVDNLSVKLFIDETQVSTYTANMGANASVIANFNFNVRGKGFKKCRITFDDTPITFDNDYYFVLNAAPTIQVLHLFGQGSQGQFIPKVFANDSVFAFKSYSANNVDVGQFRSANLVVLEGVERIDGSIKSSLDEFVQKGGSLLVIPPQKIDFQTYDLFLGKFGIRNLAPQPFPPSLSPLAEPQKQQPFFGDMFDNSTRQEMLQMPSVGTALTWQVVGEKLLSLRNGSPYLTASRYQDGRVYLLASPLDAVFGEFARNAFFVPTLYKLAALSVRQEPLAYSFGQNTVSVEVQNVQTNAVYKLKNGKTELIPVQNLNGKQLTIEMPKANQLNDNQAVESGYYELLLNGKPERMLAFNHDNEESFMEFYSPEELRKAFAGNKNVQVFDKLEDDDFVKTFKTQNFGTSLWRYFLIGALIFLGIEILLIRLMK